MMHNENIQTIDTVSKHLEMEEERLKAYAPSTMATIAKETGPRVTCVVMARHQRRVFSILKTFT